MTRKVDPTSSSPQKETVPVWAFLAALGVVGALLWITFSHFDKEQDKNDIKFQEISNRLIKIETQVEERKSDKK